MMDEIWEQQQQQHHRRCAVVMAGMYWQFTVRPKKEKVKVLQGV